MILSLFIIVGLSSCKKEREAIYEVNDEQVGPDNPYKDKLKSPEQYVTVLYANLFQRALPINELLDITDVILSIGDKELAREVLISNFMNEMDVLYPSDTIMRDDPSAYLDEAYKRFLVRKPSKLEKEWFINFLAANPDLSSEMVYFAFALSDEYLFY